MTAARKHAAGGGVQHDTLRLAGQQHASRRDLDSAITALAREFRGRFRIGSARMHTGVSLTADREPGTGGPGLYAVITPDPDEMRRVLLEDSGGGGYPRSVAPGTDRQARPG